MICRIYMIIEFVENGQIMDDDAKTVTFYNKQTSWFFVADSLLESVLTEEMGKRYLVDIVLGLQYRTSWFSYSL